MGLVLLGHRYGHRETVCWMQPQLPEGFQFELHLAQTYDESGWVSTPDTIPAAASMF